MTPLHHSVRRKEYQHAARGTFSYLSYTFAKVIEDSVVVSILIGKVEDRFTVAGLWALSKNVDTHLIRRDDVRILQTLRELQLQFRLERGQW